MVLNKIEKKEPLLVALLLVGFVSIR